MFALTAEAPRRDLLADISNKERGQHDAKGENQRDTARSAIGLDELLMAIVQGEGLNPHASKHNFYLLCMYLYVARRERLIVGFERKPSIKNLNQKIDSYHLSYLPYVDGFVTEDKELLILGKAVSSYLQPTPKIMTVDAFFRQWLRKRLAVMPS